MVCSTPEQSRANRNRCLILAVGLGLLWVTERGVVAWWNHATPQQLAMGREMFVHKWTEHDSLSGGGDGLGPVFNATSCVECHSQGGVGGGGENKFNVKTFTILPTKREPLPMSGVVHAFAVRPELQEEESTVRRHNPIVVNGMKVIGGCRVEIKDFDPVQYDSANTPALFGAGKIDHISDFAIRSHSIGRSLSSTAKELDLDFQATPTGRVHVLPDGRIGRFGWKAQFATLKEFVAAACAGELGLSNPLKKQHVPQEYREDTNAKLDMTGQQFTALVSFVENIPAPRRQTSSDPSVRAVIEHGENLFGKIGCADCHAPKMDGIEGVYSDFCLYRLTDKQDPGYVKEVDVPLPSDHPSLDEWKTPPLWGVADSAPYFHDGKAATLEEAIQRHSGMARSVRERYRKLGADEQSAIIKFLESLRAPVETAAKGI